MMIVASGMNRIAGGTMYARKIAVLTACQPGKRRRMIAYAVMYETKTLSTVEATATKSVLANHWRYDVPVSKSVMCENVGLKIQNGLGVFRSSSLALNVVRIIQKNGSSRNAA